MKDSKASVEIKRHTDECECTDKDEWLSDCCTCPGTVIVRELMADGYNKEHAIYLCLAMEIGY